MLWIRKAGMRSSGLESRLHKKICIATALGIMSLLTALKAGAHHSAAMFDEQKLMTLGGTVKSFQWTNPHCWIQILVTGQPEPIEWSVEMGSPSQLYNNGWKPKTLKPGDKIVVVIHPMRDGTHGGVFVSATDEGGNPLTAAAARADP
jgi:Family of unknown function (DUF6152)